MSFKTDPAFPNASSLNANGDVTSWAHPGLSQYAYVAAKFHAANLPRWSYTESGQVAKVAFDHADAFFAELAKRTS